VGLNVLGQVIRTHETLVADGACEALLAGVGSEVALQLVGAREPFPAEQPVANEGPLPRVPAEVRLKMRRLAVHLPTTGDVAAVDVLLAEMHSCGT